MHAPRTHPGVNTDVNRVAKRTSTHSATRRRRLVGGRARVSSVARCEGPEFFTPPSAHQTETRHRFVFWMIITIRADSRTVLARARCFALKSFTETCGMSTSLARASAYVKQPHRNVSGSAGLGQHVNEKRLSTYWNRVRASPKAQRTSTCVKSLTLCPLLSTTADVFDRQSSGEGVRPVVQRYATLAL